MVKYRLPAKYLWVLILISIFWMLPGLMAYSEERLRWEDCVREAQRNHPDILSAESQVNQARARQDIARAGMLPQIRAFASTQRSASEAYPNTDAYSYGITASQLLFDGFKTSYSVSAAGEAVRSAEYSYAAASADVRLRLRKAFINLLKEQELLSISEKIAERRRKNLDLVRLRYQAGREHKGAVLSAEANLAQAEFDVLRTRRGLVIAQQTLSKELGRRMFVPLWAEGQLSPPEKIMVTPDFESIASRNPALLMRAALKEQARFSLKAARADLAPKLYADASASRYASDWPPSSDEWSVGLNVTLPIFEGGIRRAEIARTKSALIQTEADERSAHDSVVLRLREAWTGLENAMDLVSVQQKFYEAAEARATIARAQYASGIISFDTWNIIEDDLVRAEKALLNARADALLAEADWIRAQGGTLEYAE